MGRLGLAVAGQAAVIVGSPMWLGVVGSGESDVAWRPVKMASRRAWSFEVSALSSIPSWASASRRFLSMLGLRSSFNWILVLRVIFLGTVQSLCCVESFAGSFVEDRLLSERDNGLFLARFGATLGFALRATSTAMSKYLSSDVEFGRLLSFLERADLRPLAWRLPVEGMGAEVTWSALRRPCFSFGNSSTVGDSSSGVVISSAAAFGFGFPSWPSVVAMMKTCAGAARLATRRCRVSCDHQYTMIGTIQQ